jgi:hypothetical protein
MDYTFDAAGIAAQRARCLQALELDDDAPPCSIVLFKQFAGEEAAALDEIERLNALVDGAFSAGYTAGEKHVNELSRQMYQEHDAREAAEAEVAALRAQVASLTRERDAAVHDVNEMAYAGEQLGDDFRAKYWGEMDSKTGAFHWRGLCAANAPSGAGEGV